MNITEFKRAWAEMETRGEDPVALLAALVAAERVGLKGQPVDDCAVTGYQPSCPNHGDRSTR